jgi:hypothetical protein
MPKSAEGIFGQGPFFPTRIFLCQIGEWRSDLRKVLNVSTKEIAEPQKLSNLFDIAGRLSFFNCLQLVGAREDPLLGESEPKVGGFVGCEDALFQIHPEVVSC